jgi:hypothetical protein
MGRDSGSDFRHPPASNLIAIGGQLKRSDELEVIEARSGKNRLYDRCLVPGPKKKLYLSNEGAPATARFCEEADCFGDARKPLTLIGYSRSPANQEARHQPHQYRVDAT